MIRRLFTAAAVISLVLCTASVLLWLRSYWSNGSWNFGPHAIEHGKRVYLIWSSAGRLQFWATRGPLDPLYNTIFPDISPSPPLQMMPTPPPKIFSFTWQPDVHHLSAPGIVYDMNPGWDYASLTVSWWLIAALSAVIPLAWTARFVHSRRASMQPQDNLCHSCGYDLRTSKDRCPECGMAMPLGFHRKVARRGFPTDSVFFARRARCSAPRSLIDWPHRNRSVVS